jgi:hypothetical protein
MGRVVWLRRSRSIVWGRRSERSHLRLLRLPDWKRIGVVGVRYHWFAYFVWICMCKLCIKVIDEVDGQAIRSSENVFIELLST